MNNTSIILSRNKAKYGTGYGYGYGTYMIDLITKRKAKSWFQKIKGITSKKNNV
jgi:hypothetical protein